MENKPAKDNTLREQGKLYIAESKGKKITTDSTNPGVLLLDKKLLPSYYKPKTSFG